MRQTDTPEEHPPHALVALAFLDGLTGSELVAAELAEALVRAGWRVTILTATRNEKFVANHIDARIRRRLDDPALREHVQRLQQDVERLTLEAAA